MGWSSALRFLNPPLFVAMLLAFSLPFVTVSCRDREAKLTGIELVTRASPTIEGPAFVGDEAASIRERVELLQFRALAVFIAAAVGLVVSLIALMRLRGHARYLTAAVLAIIPPVALLVLATFMGGSGEGGTQVHHNIGFWVVCALFALAIGTTWPSLFAATREVPNKLVSGIISIAAGLLALGWMPLLGLVAVPVGLVAGFVQFFRTTGPGVPSVALGFFAIVLNIAAAVVNLAVIRWT